MAIIMLVDMDYFFVACEELRHPEIKDRPAIVGSDPKGGAGRGVVMTCNYKAREYGIRSGTPISVAYRLKPDAVFLPLDYDYYETISKAAMDVIKGFSERFEQVSIDEAFIDVSGRVGGYGEAEEYAAVIKKAVLDRTRIKCSIGIGPNKLIAKIACEKAKPDGIKAVNDIEAKSFIAKLDIGEIYGVGEKTRERLRTMGYETVEQLAKANVMQMVDRFGAFGAELVRYANAIDESAVSENYGVKSIGREFTFQEDTSNDGSIEAEIEKLSNEVIEEVNRGQLNFRTITLKLRYEDFSEHIHSRSIKVTNDLDTLVATAKELYRSNMEKGRKIRKLGVRVSNLVSRKGQRMIA